MGSAAKHVRIGSFRYMDTFVEPSLHRNGKVLTHRDRDGSDGGWEGVDLETRQMPVHDALQLEGAERCTLDHNGYEALTLSLIHI